MSTGRRSAVVHGITWTALSQAIDIVVSFGAMLVLVRVIAPAEYGRAAAVVGLLGLINIFGARTFVAHAIKLPDDETPDWQAHWSIALYLQVALCLVCEIVGWACWWVPQYAPIAVLVQIAGIGILLDGPNQLGAAMLRRQLDFRLLRLLATAGTVLKLGVTVILAVAGGGAYALVIGGNVVTSLPYGVHLLIVRRWRPPLGWWRLPSLSDYRASAQFGLQQMATGVVSAASGAVEAAVLPGAIGFNAMGLLGRARALYTTTAGRLSSVVVDAVYPFLPRAAADKERYGRHSTTFLQVILFLTIPAAAFVGLEGRYISRVLYGHKWVAMDPLIWPGALSGLLTTVFVACAGILLAAGRLRGSFLIQTGLTFFSGAALLVAWSTGRVLWYGWALTAAEGCAAALALRCVAPLLAPRWYERAVYPPLVATIIAATTVIILQAAFGPMTALWQIAATTAAFSCVAVITCRIGFPSTFSALLRLVPGQQIVPAWLAGDATGA
jgi:O-antigen/teichoic acid export membrane protein